MIVLVPNDDHVTRQALSCFADEEVHIGVSHTYAHYADRNILVTASDGKETALGDELECG
jgi:hypothetical protein